MDSVVNSQLMQFIGEFLNGHKPNLKFSFVNTFKLILC